MLTPVATRRYEQRLRAQSAQDTRRRILDAVAERLREAPAEPVALDRVARMAGVSRSTIYLVFGSRAGVFDALGDEVFRRAGYAELLEAVADPDPRAGLAAALRAGVAMFATERDVARALFSMAQLDHEAVGGVIARMDENRARGTRRQARRLGQAGLLRDDVTVRQAADLLWVLSSFDSFDQLHQRGLSAAAIGDLLVATAERSLLG
jgi:AcrR family transcriptional regulator